MLREHNRIAAQLAQSYRDWDDERLFQTTRNIMIVLVLKIVIEEYINHITRYHFKLILEPPGQFRPRKWKWKWTNWMAIKFNVLYRWHSMIPDSLTLGARVVPSLQALWNPNLIVEEGLASMFNHTSRQGALGRRTPGRFSWKWPRYRPSRWRATPK